MSKEKAKDFGITEKIQSIDFLDPRQKSLSHQLYDDVEAGLRKLVKKARDDDEMSVADKTRIYTTFLKYRKELFQDIHFLIACLKDLPKEEKTQFFIMAEKIKLDNTLRDNKGKNKILS